MTVRAKPWTLANNSNTTSSCDGSNSLINGWSGGNTDDFIQQLVDECGDLCYDVEDVECTDGDLNEDGIINIQDLLTMVNHILGNSLLSDCALEVADKNDDGLENILDLVILIDIILSS